jgi:hypothetical protein
MDSDVIFLSPESPLHSRKLKFLLQGCVCGRRLPDRKLKNQKFFWQNQKDHYFQKLVVIMILCRQKSFIELLFINSYFIVKGILL